MIPAAAKFSPNKSYVVDRQMINTLNLVPFVAVSVLFALNLVPFVAVSVLFLWLSQFFSSQFFSSVLFRRLSGVLNTLPVVSKVRVFHQYAH